MKTYARVLLFMAAAAFACILAACVSAPSAEQKAQRPVRLQVTVSIPPSMSPFRDDDVAEAFAYRVCSALHEQGLQGRVKYVDDTSLKSDLPVLTISLVEWRVNRIGNVDCTFSATLTTAAGTKSLGLFTGASFMMWGRKDWFARADGYESAARDALNNLAKKIEETGLMPTSTAT